MIADGATLFTEVGPGKVLAGLIGKSIKKQLLQMQLVFSRSFSIQFQR
jgi:malonyl CoA-acyl carrier protein transacylase